MIKHLSFWIGFFAAALLIVPVAVGIWGAADEFARNVAVFLFGAISVLIFLLVLGLFFRDRLLHKILGTAETTLDDVASSLIGTVSAAVSGDRQRAEQQAQAFAKSATGWYIWSGFYRWVIGAALGLLVAFGAFTGTVLLFEQTRKLSEQTVLMDRQSDLMQAQTDRMAEQSAQFEMQNEIMTISLVSELRSQLASTADQIRLGELLVLEGAPNPEEALFLSPDGLCGVGWNPDAQLSFAPSPSIIDAVVDLAVDKQISGQVVRALEFLLRDRDSAVAFGALLALDRLVELATINLEDVTFKNLALFETRLSGAHRLEFEDSVVSFLNCNDCELALYDSYLVQPDSADVTAHYSIVLGDPDASRWSTNVLLLDSSADMPPDSRPLIPGPASESLMAANAVVVNVFGDVCESLAELAGDNDLLIYRDFAED